MVPMDGIKRQRPFDVPFQVSRPGRTGKDRAYPFLWLKPGNDVLYQLLIVIFYIDSPFGYYHVLALLVLLQPFFDKERSHIVLADMRGEAMIRGDDDIEIVRQPLTPEGGNDAAKLFVYRTNRLHGSGGSDA